MKLSSLVGLTEVRTNTELAGARFVPEFMDRSAAERVAACAREFFAAQTGFVVETWLMSLWQRGTLVLVRVGCPDGREHTGNLIVRNGELYGAHVSSDCGYRHTGGNPVIFPLLRPAHQFTTGKGAVYSVFTDGSCSRQKYSNKGRYILFATVHFLTEDVARTPFVSDVLPATSTPAPGLVPLEFGRVHDMEPSPVPVFSNGRLTLPTGLRAYHLGDPVASVQW